MSDYQISEKITTQRSVNCFIPDPLDSDGGGFSYTATSNIDDVLIEYKGRVRHDRVATVVELMELALKEDKNRMEEFGSPSFGFYMSDTDEEFREEIEESVKLEVVGPNPDDFWIARHGYADERTKCVTTYALMRYSNLYILLEGPFTLMNFSCFELEGMIALLKAFLPQD